MTVSQLELALARRHHNRQLFAERHLDEALPRRQAWRDLAAEAAPVLAQIRAIVAGFAPADPASQVDRDLVRPVLAALGHTLAAPADGAADEQLLLLGDGAPLAVGAVRPWERGLDVAAAGLARSMRASGATWGLLTNGRRWRLYHRDSAVRLDHYYEVDLPELAAAADPAALLYCYAFFRRAAFDPAAGELTLEGALRESAAYSRAVSDALAAQLAEALRHLAQGFLDYPRNRLVPTPATLRAVHRAGLTVLDRLLFVFDAEARELLPLRESPSYRDSYSLSALVREVARRLDGGLTLLADTGQTWARLRDLFGIIQAGSPPLGVAAFDDGLFDPRRHPFLERHAIGDAQLQRALDRLARVAGPPGRRELVDYRDLAAGRLAAASAALQAGALRPIARGPDGFSVELLAASANPAPRAAPPIGAGQHALPDAGAGRVDAAPGASPARPAQVSARPALPRSDDPAQASLPFEEGEPSQG